jgi:hypothetical protein
MENVIETSEAETLALRLAEKVRQEYGEGATIDRLLLVASVTEEDGSQRAVVESNGLPLYEQAGTLLHARNTLTREST